jgi:acetyl-CoA acyltransferase
MRISPFLLAHNSAIKRTMTNTHKSAFNRKVYVIGGKCLPFIGKGHPDFISKNHPDFGKRNNPTIEDLIKDVVKETLNETKGRE